MSNEKTENDLKIIPTVFHLFRKQYKLKNLAMNNTLMAYLDKRLHQKDSRYPSANTQPGPAICISREVGWRAILYSELLDYKSCMPEISLDIGWKVMLYSGL